MKIFLLVLAVASVSGDENYPLKSISTDNSAFPINLYQTLTKGTQENIAFSAIPVQTVLALTTLGSKGTTSTQLRSVLKLNSSDEQIRHDFRAISQTMNNTSDVEIYRASKVHISDGIEVEPEFLKAATEDFHIKIENIDFESPRETADKINAWVETKTDFKIENIVNEKQLHKIRFARFVLISVLYFRGGWLKPFDVGATEKKAFHISKTETVQVDTMKLSTHVLMSRNSEYGVTLFELPFENKDAKMTIFVPDELDGLDATEKNLQNIWEQRNLNMNHATVFLPKFMVESNFDLLPALKEMGIIQLFSYGNAELSGITKENIYLSAVLQKTLINVNETGVDAFSANTVSTTSLPIPGEPTQVINVNRPFMYCVHFQDLVLVAGRVKNL